MHSSNCNGWSLHAKEKRSSHNTKVEILYKSQAPFLLYYLHSMSGYRFISLTFGDEPYWLGCILLCTVNICIPWVLPSMAIHPQGGMALSPPEEMAHWEGHTCPFLGDSSGTVEYICFVQIQCNILQYVHFPCGCMSTLTIASSQPIRLPCAY